MMRPYGRHLRARPAWWPDNEPWPPRRAYRPGNFGRRFFLYRVAAVLVFALVFGTIGLARLIASLAGQAGLSLPVPFLGVALFLIIVVLPAVFWGSMRGFGLPLSDIVAAADRVGKGDYSARLVERGPPFLRSVARAFNTMTTRLEAQERQRRDLMADVAHELRTPLSIMRGRLEGLADGVYPRDDTTLVQLLDETKHLERLVEDLRTLAHSESGTLKLQREVTDLGVLINDVVRAFAAAAQTAAVDLRVAIPGELPLVDIDAVRIREVLANIVANALRHTPRGGRVSIGAEVLPAGITVRVEDTGSGIHPDQVAKVFDRFAKGVDSSGSGLGLAIARNLVVAHGGEIRAESRLGEGTTMTFTLPMTRPDRP
jgi:signal transduction histidine kinase